MPPKRGARGGASSASRASRAPSRARGTPAPSGFDGAGDESPSSDTVLRTPGPAKFSTSYGSPATLGTTRQFSAGNAISAIGGALKNVQAANKEDRQSRAARQAAEARSRGDRAPTQVLAQDSPAAQASQSSQEDNGDLDVDEDDEASQAMPPPPRPRPSQRSAAASSLAQNSRQATQGFRATSAQPTSSRPAAPPGRGRLDSEPPHSDAPSQRSFIEESQLYGGADVATPREQGPATTQPPNVSELINPQQQRPQPLPHRNVQQSPIRSSARIAAKASTDIADSVPPTPSRPVSGGNSNPQAFTTVSDSIDDEDDEDPLADPTPRGLRTGRGMSAASQSQAGDQRPDLMTRIRLAGLGRSNGPTGIRARNPFISGDDEDEDPAPAFLGAHAPEGPNFSRQPRPNPVQDARSGDLLLPLPDRTASQPPVGDDSAGGNTTSSHITDAPGRPMNRTAGNSSRRASSAESQDQGSQQGDRYGAGPAGTPADGIKIRGQQRRGPNNPGPVMVEPAAATVNNDGYKSPFTMLLNWFYSIFRISRWPKKLRKALELYALFVLVCWALLVLLEVYVPVSRWEGVRVGKKYEYHGLTGWRQNILQFVPWIVLHPFAVLTGNLDYADFRNTLWWLEINTQHNEIRQDFLAGATFQMRRVLPALIKVNVEKNGNWGIEDSFWHALDEKAKQGNVGWSLLTMEQAEDGSWIIPDYHWDAIRQRIQNERLSISDHPAEAEDTPTLSHEVQAYVDQFVSQSWNDWLRKNQEAVDRLHGKDKGTPSAAYTDLYGYVEKVVAERLKDLDLEERVVTRKEFIEKMEHEFYEHKAEIRTQLKVLDKKLDEAKSIAMEARKSTKVLPGLTRTEVEDIADEVVRRAVADAGVEAIAKGHIKAHLKNELYQKKNYFSIFRGALVDGHMTSYTYDWRPKKAATEEKAEKTRWIFAGTRKKPAVYREGGEDPSVPFGPDVALEKWEEDGECWCAALGDANNITRAADLVIHTAETVIPQHLVVEHISRSATFDPDSMPKDLELWIRAPSDRRSRTLRDWAIKKWPEIRGGPSWRLVQRGFVKVGEFHYDSSLGIGASQVFKVTEDLLDMDAQTRQVLVRAKTNYGSEDRTCFYRLRLFGEAGRNKNEGALS